MPGNSASSFKGDHVLFTLTARGFRCKNIYIFQVKFKFLPKMIGKLQIKI
jgi:hypothetical protein